MLQWIDSHKNKQYSSLISLYVPLFFSGIVGIYAKASLMGEYWLSIARLLGKDALPFQMKLSYFSLDLLVNFFLLPCILIAFSCLFSRKRALVIATLISCLLIIFYFIQFRVQDEVGQYASSTLLYEAFLFAIKNPDLASGYVNKMRSSNYCLSYLQQCLARSFFLWRMDRNG